MNTGRARFLGNPLLATERLILRKFTTEDALDVFEYAKEPEVARFVTWYEHKSIGDSVKYINWTLDRCDSDEAGEWAIEYRDTGRVIGSMGFVQLDTVNSCGSIGYVISKDYWGRGLMSEAVRRLIRFSFQEMGLNRIEAVHIPENEASGRVMQKAGMVYEGLLKQRMYAKGRFWDVKQYAAVKEDWSSV